MPDAERIVVSVAYARADQQWDVTLEVGVGTTAAQALELASAQLPLTAQQLEALPLGIYGELVEPSRILQPHDRVELYRPLLVDPKTARRQRAAESAPAVAAAGSASGASGAPDAGK